MVTIIIFCSYYLHTFEACIIYVNIYCFINSEMSKISVYWREEFLSTVNINFHSRYFRSGWDFAELAQLGGSLCAHVYAGAHALWLEGSVAAQCLSQFSTLVFLILTFTILLICVFFPHFVYAPLSCVVPLKAKDYIGSCETDGYVAISLVFWKNSQCPPTPVHLSSLPPLLSWQDFHCAGSHLSAGPAGRWVPAVILCFPPQGQCHRYLLLFLAFVSPWI